MPIKKCSFLVLHLLFLAFFANLANANPEKTIQSLKSPADSTTALQDTSLVTSKDSLAFNDSLKQFHLDSLRLDSLRQDSLKMVEAMGELDSSVVDQISALGPLSGSPLKSLRYLKSDFVSNIFPWSAEGPGSREIAYVPGSMMGAVGAKLLFSRGLNIYQNYHAWGGTQVFGQGEYSKSLLNLYTNNGVIQERDHVFPNNMPMLLVHWSKSALEGNHFRMLFKRLLSPNLQLGFYVNSFSTDSTTEWTYQNSVHQPFLGGMLRDSSSVPFTGRRHKMEAWEFFPWVSWKRPGYKLKYTLLASANKSEDTPKKMPIIPTKGDIAFWKLLGTPFQAKRELDGHQLSLDIDINDWQFVHQAHLISRRNYFKTPETYSNLPTDTIKTSTLSEEWKEKETLVGATHKMIAPSQWLPRTVLEWEFRKVRNLHPRPYQKSLSNLEEDRQLGYLEWNLKTPKFQVNPRMGVQRVSTPEDEAFTHPTADIDLDFNHSGSGLSAQGRWQYAYKYPSLEQRYFFRSGRLEFPNQNLDAELLQKLSLDVQWNSPKWKSLGAGAGIYSENIQNFIASKTPIMQTPPDSNRTQIQDTLAFGLRNWEELKNLYWQAGIRFGLGNWRFHIQHWRTLKRTLNDPNLLNTDYLMAPKSWYQGSIVWKDKVLSKKQLGLEFRWDWEWYGAHWQYEENSNEYHKANPVELKHHLVLDFEARMKILDFIFYGRFNNLNHSRIYSDVGYTPPGINIQYGVIWLFKG